MACRGTSGKSIDAAQLESVSDGRAVNHITAPRISVTKRADAQPLAPSRKEWKYLESNAFAIRNVLAANFVSDCRSVVEIGGAKSPIDQFLTGPHESVLVLDPLIQDAYAETMRGTACQVSHVRARFQDVDWYVPQGANYGLVMLGLEIHELEPHDYDVLFNLVNQARMTVVEFSTSWRPAAVQFEIIRTNTRTRESFRAKIDLTGNDFGDLTRSWPPRCERAMHVLEPM